jgi:pimeloyl-ACP methyl ester carboxylesterase
MVPVPGGRLYVRANGPLDGPLPPILMAHGGPGSAHAVFLPGLALADERAVILYDQLDCGRSERPGDPGNWRVERFVDEVAAIGEALGLQRFHLLGHSWGAVIALEYGARRRAGLASLILQGALISTRIWLEDAAALLDTLPPESRDDPEAFYARYWRLRPQPTWLDAYEAANAQASNRVLYEAMWGPHEFRATGSLADYDGEALLTQLDAPTLFLLGDSDEITERTARRFAAAAHAEVAIIPDAAHRLQTDQPRRWVAELRRWLRRHDAETRRPAATKAGARAHQA